MADIADKLVNDYKTHLDRILNDDKSTNPFNIFVSWAIVQLSKLESENDQLKKKIEELEIKFKYHQHSNINY